MAWSASGHRRHRRLAQGQLTQAARRQGHDARRKLNYDCANRAQETKPVNQPEDQRPATSLPLAMLISEAVYRLVVLVERTLRWLVKFVLRPCLLQFRCLFW